MTIDFNHEISKVKKALENGVIGIVEAQYEAKKLNCLAIKENVQWNFTAFGDVDIVDERLINRDIHELYGLYEQGSLTKSQFLRDNAKIIALCEHQGIRFPGNHKIAQQLKVDKIAGLLVENDILDSGSDFSSDYDELEDDDEFGDDEEEESEPEQIGSIELEDGSVIEAWSENSEIETYIVIYNEHYDTNDESIYQNNPALVTAIVKEFRKFMAILSARHHNMDLSEYNNWISEVENGNLNQIASMVETLANSSY